MKDLIRYILLILLFQSNLSSQWWERVDLPSSYAGNYWLDVYFLESNPNYGWICGYNGSVLRTTNRGTTWEGVTIRGAYQLESIHFVNENIGYTSGIGDLSSGVIYKSTDGGRTWRDITPNGTSTNLWGNFFITPNIGLVIGGGCNDYQNFYRTTDGGLSWSLFRANMPNTGLCDLILYDANGLGYASSSGRIWRTNDGGRTWSVFSVSGREDWQEEISHQGNTFIVPFSEGCTGGGIGGIRSSNDLGKTWREFRTGVPMFGTFVHDSLRGWGCGHNGKVYYTNDGGRSWFLQSCGLEGRDMDDIWFINDTTGFVVGAGVYQYKLKKNVEPIIIASSDTLYCPGDSIILTVDKAYPSYKWSTGETTRSIIARSPGTYWVYAYVDTCNYGISQNFTLYQSPKPTITLSIQAEQPLCEGDTAIITVNEDFRSYQWINGTNSKSIEVTKSGKYIVSVVDEHNCTWTAETEINFLPNPKPKIDILGRENFCEGDTTILITSQTSNKYLWYELGNNRPIAEGKNSISITKSGSFYLIVENVNGCINISDTVNIIVRQDTNLLSMIFDSGTKSVNFGKTKIRELSCSNLIIRNNNSDSVTLNNIPILRNIYFSIPQSIYPITIAPNNSYSVLVCFNPSIAKELKDTIYLPDVCNDHIIPLIGEGEEIIYRGSTRCGLTVKLTDKGKEIPIIYTFDPYPNPTNNILQIDFEAQSEAIISEIMTTYLYDIIGKPINIYPSIFIVENDLETKVLKGRIIYDLSSLQKGVYYLIINKQLNSEVFPVIVE